MIKATLILALLVLSVSTSYYDPTIKHDVIKKYHQLGPDAISYTFPSSPMTNCMAGIIHDVSSENSVDLRQKLDI